jgi:hypothetical protein
MIHPTCREVLATVQSAFEREIVPRLTNAEARSTAATIEHLLRHIDLRIAHEGRFLTADIVRLVALLDEAVLWMEGKSLETSAVKGCLAGEADVSRSYRNLDELGESALALRGALVGVQASLADHGEDDPAAQDLQDRIREYIGLQLLDEAQLIEPAYSGRGPRR